MNDKRRKAIRQCVLKLEICLDRGLDLIKYKAAVEEVKSELENIYYDESDAFDNMPEGLQSSMRGEESEEAIDALEDAIDCLNECLSLLEDEDIENAKDELSECYDCIFYI